MTNDAELDMVSSRVSSLESRVASVESQGSPDDAGVKAGQDCAPQPTVDPKGRKIWEAEWRQDYGVLLAYVPINALIIDGENVEVKADDKDGDEVTFSDGSWYLHAYKNKTTGNGEAELDQEPTGTREDEEAKYNIHICDINKDGYIEKQYVVGSIVIGGAGSKFVGDDEEGASEEIDSSDGVIHLQGFKGEADGERTGNSGLEFLTVGARKGENGEKIPPKVIIDIKGRSTASGCGNTDNWGCHSLKKDGNLLGHFLGCKDIDIIKEGGGGGGGAANIIGSDYIDVLDETDEQGQATGKRKVEAKTNTPIVDDRTVEKPAHALLTHDTDQFVRCSKTFLPPGPPNVLAANSKRVIIDGPNAKIRTKSSDGDKTVEIDAATGVETLKNGEKSIVLAPSNLEDGDTVDVREITVKDKNGAEKKIKVLATGDFTLGGVESVNKADGRLFVIGGKGIEVTTDGKTIKITANEKKQEEDPDPQPPEGDPCAHPGDKNNDGGVSPNDDEPGGGGAAGGGGGGVSPGDGGIHPGDDGCNCD